MNCFALTLISVFVMLSGCTPSYRVVTDASNYREKLTIKKKDITFYNGEYIGSSIKCFPPIENRICEDYTKGEIYKPTKELKMEEFEITINDHSTFASKIVKDMAYLTGAELTEQRGFKTFTVPYSLQSVACTSIYSVNTYGTIQNNSYSGSSYLSNDGICANSYTINVLMYDSQEDITRGVLYRSNGYKSSYLYPYKYLYAGVSLGLDQELRDKTIKILESNKGVMPQVERDAWKIHYDVKRLSEELRKQYGLAEKLPYSFTDERDKHKEQQADPVEKYKIQ